MPSRRDLIKMTPDEVDAFLHETHTMNVATIGRDGTPHLVAMWYGFLGDAPAFWTFGKSQKIKNLERDPRITCLVEAGDEYAQLRGVELVGRGTVITATDDIVAIGLSTSERHTGADPEASRPFVEAQAGKRLGVRIDVEKVVSWDHRKLEGRY
jgi:PPOX class probable F420-dependent enzyme